MTLTIWVPFADLTLPPDVDRDRVGVFTDSSGAPGPAGAVEFWALPHPVASSSAAMLADMPNLRVLQLISSGVDHVLPYLPPGVAVHNAPHLRAESTAEAAVSLILASLNNMSDWFALQRRKQWEWLPPRRCLTGKTVLLVGYGAVGQQIRRMLSGFDVDVVVVAQHPRPGIASAEQLDTLVPTADVVVLALPLTERTRHLFGREQIGNMKDGALLVNVSRGEIVDTAALLHALSTTRITAALDVTDPEPLPDGHPLWSAPGLLISPHVGGNPLHIEVAARAFLTEQIDRFVSGRELEFPVSLAT
ncbi:NAD(P)-dependent oxidoreductase [Nocardia sp. R7R-8]|uniref:NAD(P)-dependent oxidoreductase n=1 Tax=Nocardia sp. R7R-8 TaxID=3459304 RepID=UPI00403DA48E